MTAKKIISNKSHNLWSADDRKFKVLSRNGTSPAAVKTSGSYGSKGNVFFCTDINVDLNISGKTQSINKNWALSSSSRQNVFYNERDLKERQLHEQYVICTSLLFLNINMSETWIRLVPGAIGYSMDDGKNCLLQLFFAISFRMTQIEIKVYSW